MTFFCNVCDKTIKLKSKTAHFKSSIQKEFDRCKHRKLTIENPNMNDIDKIFHAYIIEHD